MVQCVCVFTKKCTLHRLSPLLSASLLLPSTQHLDSTFHSSPPLSSHSPTPFINSALLITTPLTSPPPPPSPHRTSGVHHQPSGGKLLSTIIVWLHPVPKWNKVGRGKGEWGRVRGSGAVGGSLQLIYGQPSIPGIGMPRHAHRYFQRESPFCAIFSSDKSVFCVSDT